MFHILKEIIIRDLSQISMNKQNLHSFKLGSSIKVESPKKGSKGEWKNKNSQESKNSTDMIVSMNLKFKLKYN